MRPIKVALTIFLVAVFGQVAYVMADDNQDDGDPSSYQFYPDSPMYLGGGVSPNNVSDAKPQCIKPFETTDLDNGAALTTNFSLTFVTNDEQLKQALSLDAKIDASYLTFKGGHPFHMIQNHFFHQVR